jgi:hypothetical protein
MGWFQGTAVGTGRGCRTRPQPDRGPATISPRGHATLRLVTVEDGIAEGLEYVLLGLRPHNHRVDRVATALFTPRCPR